MTLKAYQVLSSRCDWVPVPCVHNRMLISFGSHPHHPSIQSRLLTCNFNRFARSSSNHELNCVRALVTSVISLNPVVPGQKQSLSKACNVISPVIHQFTLLRHRASHSSATQTPTCEEILRPISRGRCCAIDQRGQGRTKLYLLE